MKPMSKPILEGQTDERTLGQVIEGQKTMVVFVRHLG
ncbi:hypothetical protein N783_08600 [Pontibacillus marinus BH030004 = DSM 16465]|uniref:Uncharacterized protein n=1 Tax=Pontibacillus marinus BH030004 = DSM 16465 TaxID=1385511 RepID=A0A0A5GB39_9BACI|nr:hypothetical protein N783_08600 [Pontibacillus marinus BH030004 = DSM 16465]